MKPQNLRIILVAAVSLAAGSALTVVLAQQELPAVPATQPAVTPMVAPATVPATPAAAAVAESAPSAATTEPAAPVEAAAVDAEPSTPTTSPTNPSTGPSATPATAPSAGPATAPSAAPATRPVDGGSSRYGSGGSSRYGRSSSRDGDSRNEPTTRPSTPDVAAVTIPPTKPIDKKYEVLLARSLFSKERPRPPVDYTPKPPPSGPSTPPPALAPEKSMAVRGLSIEGEGEEDDAFYAFIEDLPLKMMKRVKVGDKIARGIVAEVTLADMVYEFEGKRTRVPIGHTLDGAPAPAVTWSTYVPVAAAPPPGSRGGDPRSGGGDSRGGDPRSSGDSRGGDSRGGDSRGSGDSRGGPTPSAGPTPPAPTPAPSPAPVASTETPAATPATAPATPAASGTPAAGAGDDLLERMRRRREQEGGR